MTACLVSAAVFAGEAQQAGAAVQTSKPALSKDEISVTGKLSKDDKGNYILTEADGTEVKLKVMKGESNHNITASDLDGRIANSEKLGKNVVITGKGRAITMPGGKKTKIITKITGVTYEEIKAEVPKKK